MQIATVPPSVQPVIDISISNLRPLPPPRHHSQHQPQLRHPQQLSTIRSQSLPSSSQANYLPPPQQKPITHQAPPVAVVPPSPKKPLPSLQITLTSDENERNPSSKLPLPKPTIETKNSDNPQNFQQSAGVLVGGGSRSAFRPFLKSNILNSSMQIPLNINLKPQIPPNQYIQK